MLSPLPETAGLVTEGWKTAIRSPRHWSTELCYLQKIPTDAMAGDDRFRVFGEDRNILDYLLYEVHIPFAIDRDEVSCTLVAGPCLVDHFCGHIGKTPRG